MRQNETWEQKIARVQAQPAHQTAVKNLQQSLVDLRDRVQYEEYSESFGRGSDDRR